VLLAGTATVASLLGYVYGSPNAPLAPQIKPWIDLALEWAWLWMTLLVLLAAANQRSVDHRRERALWTALEDARSEEVPRIWRALEQFRVTHRGQTLWAADVFFAAGHHMGGKTTEEMLRSAAGSAGVDPETFRIAYTTAYPQLTVHALWETVVHPTTGERMISLLPVGRRVIAYATVERGERNRRRVQRLGDSSWVGPRTRAVPVPKGRVGLGGLRKGDWGIFPLSLSPELPLNPIIRP